MYKTVFIIIALWLGRGHSSAQDLISDGGDERVQMTVGQAMVIDYWARKGIASVPYTDRLEAQVTLLEKSADFQSQINSNLRGAMEEYRTQVANAVVRNNQLQTDLSVTKEARDSWKIKAQRRGYQNVGLIVIIGIMTYVTLKT